MTAQNKKETRSAPGRVRKIAVIASFAIVLSIFASIYILLGLELHSKSTINFLVLRPSPPNKFYDQELVPGIKKQSLFIKCLDGSKLNVWFYRVPGSDKLAIVNHGNAGNIANRAYIANALTKAGCSVLLYDYRGYGLSTGTPSIIGILDDGVRVYDYARATWKYPGNKILLYGESIGTAVTCNLALKRTCAAVILQSGISSLLAAGRHLFVFLYAYPNFVFPEPHLYNVDAVKSIHVPILFLHGKMDHTVPYQQSEQLFANANEPKQLVLLPNCGHNDMGVQDSSQFHSAIEKFVAQIR
jgi:uncharacterized protein